MQPSDKCRANIKEFETCARLLPDGRYRAYPDPASGGDPWTIGWGSTGPDITPSTIWTKEQCDDRFERDLADKANQVRAAIGNTPTTQGQFDALVSFAYNARGWAGSTLLSMHKAGKYAEAQKQFMRWVYARGPDGKPYQMKGLIRRRDAEAALYAGN